MELVGDERREMTIKGRKRCATNRKLKNQKQKQATRAANNSLKREMILHEKNHSQLKSHWAKNNEGTLYLNLNIDGHRWLMAAKWDDRSLKVQ